ncbi:hypothetical protein GCM10023142_02860 [Anaerocolumna aminovalerica]|uniref:Lipoprotein n=1 Tax=Anaerocolumna aminovalerica TaxID=1527 RepID=A0A1I5BQ69_9FIRM|nr:hypothetical protein [Anaerocolumna aminovalerica]SFN76833.1 hypothetical protein SAMN04489757_101145 [Anaerocolumna aminovalerica]
MKKLVSIVAIALLVLTGCTSNLMNSIYNNEEKITSDTNSYNLNEAEQKIEEQKFSGTIEFEGMDTIWTFNSEEDTEIDMTYLFKVSRGKAKLVLISPDETLTTLIETTKNSDAKDYAVNQIPIKKGLNRIKLVAANNAKIEFDININYGTFDELGM